MADISSRFENYKGFEKVKIEPPTRDSWFSGRKETKDSLFPVLSAEQIKINPISLPNRHFTHSRMLLQVLETNKQTTQKQKTKKQKNKKKQTNKTNKTNKNKISKNKNKKTKKQKTKTKKQKNKKTKKSKKQKTQIKQNKLARWTRANLVYGCSTSDW